MLSISDHANVRALPRRAWRAGPIRLLPEQEPEQLKSNGVAELVENSQGVRGFVPLPPRRMMIENFVPISTSIQSAALPMVFVSDLAASALRSAILTLSY